MEDKKYWHELTDDEVNSLYEEHCTWGDIMENYKQPDWCNYPNALEGQCGCWSLLDKDFRKKISLDFCENCDSCNEDYLIKYELNMCELCVQMTNHLNGICQKCKQKNKEL